MSLEDVIISRKSVRSYSNKEIENVIIEKMLQAAQQAPSCQNKQCWRFILIKDHTLKKQLALKSGFIGKANFFIKDAPLVVVACANPKNSCRLNDQNYYLVDTAIAFQQMMLMAWNFGIGSCWLAAFNEEKVKTILSIPKQIRVIAMSPFGYPEDSEKIYGKLVSSFAGSNKRKKIDSIFCYDKWSL